MSMVLVSPSLEFSHVCNKGISQKGFSSSSSVPVIVRCKCSNVSLDGLSVITLRNKLPRLPRFIAGGSVKPVVTDVSLNWGDDEHEEVEDMESPWEGAIMFKRDASVSHVEYCTTLERLGLLKLSSEVSKSRASTMGIRITKAVKDYPHGTAVQVSIDVTRKKKKLRLDGIVKTVITLDCNRCGQPAAKSIYSDFSLLLTEEPVEEPEAGNSRLIFGNDNNLNFSSSNGEQMEDDDDTSIDWEDQLYFPPGDKEIDISKQIRDLVHVEITINALCDPNCKGACLQCGTNFNTSSCSCDEETMQHQNKSYGPLKNLRQQMRSIY